MIVSPGTCGLCYHSTDSDIRHELLIADTDGGAERVCLWPCGHHVYRDDDHACPFHPEMAAS